MSIELKNLQSLVTVSIVPCVLDIFFIISNIFLVTLLQAVWPHSGHYRPTEENFRDFVSFLEENNVDLTDVKV